MAVAGALIGKAIGAYGVKPKIPHLPDIDPSKVQGETIAGNQAALGDAQRLGAEVNRFNQQQQLGMLSKAMEFAAGPGALGNTQSLIASQIRGEIPDDVGASVMRSAAGKAFAGGFGGSGLASNMGLRDLGLTSLGIQQQGLANLQSFAGMASSPLFDITSMFFSPQQRLQFEFQDRDANFQRNLMAAQVKAAPDPATAALGREIDRFFNTAAQFGTMAGGQAMGGGGGGGGMMMQGGVQGGWGYGGGGGFNQNWLQQQSTAGSAMGAAIG